MYASQDSKTGNCSAAVQFYWKHALERFSELPPAYSKDITPYADHQSISFVDLYNPGQSPTVDCVFITCQPKIEAQSKKWSGGLEIETVKQPVHSLVCVSTSQAPQDSHKPFTLDHWNKIKGARKNSAQPTLFAAFTSAVAALVHSLA
uniref:Surface antigen 5 n=1 Tax=Eimeria stiedai TaxID=471275 RepID=A0A6H0C5Z9_9EIME|nr:surface antigen 5 [Eimeria stiedai]